MSKRLFLTSTLAMCVAGPAFALNGEATTTNTEQTFPQDGLMQEDTTYEGAAVYSILHVDGSTEDPAIADPNFTICPANSYCPGTDSNAQPDSTAIFACSTEASGAFPYSDAGSDNPGQCYENCAASDVAHAATLVNGGRIYLNGTRTCSAATCVQGYHIVPGVYDLASVIGTEQPVTMSVVDGSGSNLDGNATTYGISGMNNTFVIDFGGNIGRLKGHAYCSSTSGSGGFSANGPTSYSWMGSPSVVEPNGGDSFYTSGNYCYCQLESFTPYSSGTAGTEQALSYNKYVFNNTVAAGQCNASCANQCANMFGYTDNPNDATDAYARSQFRQAMIDSLGTTNASCAANIINITWNGATEANINANQAGWCEYDSDVRTPVAATPRPGYTFSGWTFQDNTTPAQQGSGQGE